MSTHLFQAQTQLTITWSLPRPIHSGQELRGFCSSFLSRIPGAQAMFHRDPDGFPVSGLSAFRFHAEGLKGRLYAVGDKASLIAGSAMHALLAEKIPRPWIGIQSQEFEVALTAKETAQSWWVPHMVICANAVQFKRWNEANEDARQAHLQKLIASTLSRQCQMLGEMPPANWSITQINFSAERSAPRLSNDAMNEGARAYVRVASVRFSAPYEFDGHWCAGGLASRGMGGIVALPRHSGK